MKTNVTKRVVFTCADVRALIEAEARRQLGCLIDDRSGTWDAKLEFFWEDEETTLVVELSRET